jgi:hypothetical protein
MPKPRKQQVSVEAVLISVCPVYAIRDGEATNEI